MANNQTTNQPTDNPTTPAPHADRSVSTRAIAAMFSLTREQNSELVNVHLISDLIDTWNPAAERTVWLDAGSGYSCFCLTDEGFKRYIAAMEEVGLDDPMHLGTVVSLTGCNTMLGIDDMIGDGDGNYIAWRYEPIPDDKEEVGA